MLHAFAADSQLTPLLKGQEMGMHNDVPAGFSMETAFSSSAASHARLPLSMNPQLMCRHCHHEGVDVKMLECGCCFHAVSYTTTGMYYRITILMQLGVVQLVFIICLFFFRGSGVPP